MIVRHDVSGRPVIGNLALGQVGVLLAQHRADVLQPHAVAVELGRIDVDAHARKRASANGDVAHSVNLRQPLLHDGRRGVIEAAAIVDLRRERDDHDRCVGRIDLAIGWVGWQIGREVAASGVDRRLHVTGRSIDVAVQVKLQRHARRAEIAGRGHLGHTGDPPELPFERRRHRGRHNLGTGARQAGTRTDTVGKSICGSQRRNRQPSVRHGAGQHHTAAVSRVVATGRSMKGVERLS